MNRAFGTKLHDEIEILQRTECLTWNVGTTNQLEKRCMP